MEESVKRRDRLKAMRLEADQTEVSNNVETSVLPGSLSNPLIEPSETLSVQEESRVTPRFDFYTDPMSAFSANKTRNQNRQDSYTPNNTRSPMAQNSSINPASINPQLTPSSAHQMQSYYSQQGTAQSHGPYNHAASYGSPRVMASTPMHPGTPESWNGSGHAASYYSMGFPRSEMANPFPMHQGTLEAVNRSGCCSFPSNPSMDFNIPSPGFRPIGSPRSSYGQGRAHWLGNTANPDAGHRGRPGPNPGRGTGQFHWYSGNMSPGSGIVGGRGADIHNRGSGRNVGPKSFFHRSMVEDPWQHLKPVVWKGVHDSANSLNSPGSSNTWFPKSISMKKARVSEASSKSSPQPSLAEYLAASFNDAINHTPSS
ncbi:hypothetical protein CFOL_v3_10355 [Cephalotus follicularis]|uniref:Uncharacterized protein n=1 Tax=Cephalotus follicularis TaxID=3775 RepID=A0A1Q3BFZ4_CEPFO|nr:hypothetical protein CFOL_v3_10355 [Cephalotus follicularis]